ncbi:McrC family protein [Sphingobacterium anhuiense]|uniref:McrC family protein n=1 Tax=Sphingobacterium anhuiense TaxID=493780 RepID=A0ABW5YQ71_9SPHI
MHQVIQVYEHDVLLLNHVYKTIGGQLFRFEKHYFDALLKFNELHGAKYFIPIYDGVKFKSYVGVLQIDNLIIEVLPKIERVTVQVKWRDVLIQMLQQTEHLRVEQVGNAFVDKQDIHLLDIYFDWFLSEVEHLQHRGLIKKYYSETKNTLALKGKLKFSGHIQRNNVHQERFYTTHQVYGTDHLLHHIINIALKVVGKLSKGTYRYGRCKTVQLYFPEVKDVNLTKKTFESLSYSRKNESYRRVIEISRLIILNYAPNVNSGSENMLALMFNMNNLWEQYLLVKIQQASKDWLVTSQVERKFWKNKIIRPDIILQHKETKQVYIIDSKWKNYSYESISSQDLRQIYVYSDYWQATGGMLLYPHHITLDDTNLHAVYNARQFHAKIGLFSILDEAGELKEDIGVDVIRSLCG